MPSYTINVVAVRDLLPCRPTYEYRRCAHGVPRQIAYCTRCQRARYENGARHATSVDAVLEVYYGPRARKYTGPVTFY